MNPESSLVYNAGHDYIQTCQLALLPLLSLRQATSKITIPGRKWAYRLLGSDGVPILDIMLLDGENPPRPGVPILARLAKCRSVVGVITSGSVLLLCSHEFDLYSHEYD